MEVFAVAWGEMVVLLWASAIAAISIASTLWARAALRGVSVEVAFEPSRAFVGEDVTLRVRIANEKSLPPDRPSMVRYPFSLLPLRTWTPPRSAAADDASRSRGGAVELRLPVVVATRGEYWLEGVDVVVSDPFDLAPVKHEATTDRPPRDARAPRRDPSDRPAAAVRFACAPSVQLFETEHFAGVRDYEPGDPMHHVHWRLSAHAGKLQTKRYEPTRSAEVLFALDVANGEPFWHAVDPDTAEESIGWTSYLARQAIHAGWRTGLVANTHLRRGHGPRVRTSDSAGNEAALFAALARMPNQPTSDLGPCCARSAGGWSARPPSSWSRRGQDRRCPTRWRCSAGAGAT